MPDCWPLPRFQFWKISCPDFLFGPRPIDPFPGCDLYLTHRASAIHTIRYKLISTQPQHRTCRSSMRLLLSTQDNHPQHFFSSQLHSLACKTLRSAHSNLEQMCISYGRTVASSDLKEYPTKCLRSARKSYRLYKYSECNFGPFTYPRDHAVHDAGGEQLIAEGPAKSFVMNFIVLQPETSWMQPRKVA